VKTYSINCGKDKHLIGLDDDGVLHLIDHDIEEEETQEAFGDTTSECYQAYKLLLTSPKDALVISVNHGFTDMIQLCLDIGADIHYDNDAPLLAACHEKRLNVVKMLVEAGANVNAHKIVRQEGPMVMIQISAVRTARHRSTPEVVEYLKSVGAVE